jgi:curli production assembly/transport component CsgF
MKMKIKNMSLVSVHVMASLMALLSFGVVASELRYTPVNPTFGGNPLNASGLQANASSQNTTKAPPVAQPTALEKFTTNIQNAIISKLQTAAINGLFDAKGNFNPDVGTNIKAGNFQIQITTDPATGGLTLITTDITSGQSTSISINALGGLQ